ncbi:uncharacterized protein LOC121410009 [Lytechinus variegatus]|uniref:uncharacterized protein LOC121410008 n=1 Tax=Lytechinus variegatus TaxID=7654 RepID=UPI001BB26141|nr:uncharacterized protein LOC121410008 [Lytechinus variegatus]XP_041457752.1 uncharacterized protein LOC121410009 [Lytechinus variegatus]
MMSRLQTTDARHDKFRKKGLDFDKLCIDDTIDEGYSSGNPPPFTTQYPKLDVSSDAAPSKMSKKKVINNWTPKTENQNTDSQVIEGNHSSATEETVTRPKMLPRTESRTFVFIYDEEEKKSKAVAAPDNLKVDVPVLLQYNLTEEAIEKCLEKPQLGESPTEESIDETDNNSNIPAVTSDNKVFALGGKYTSPTESLLRNRERDELKNKGMHVVKWLVNLDHTNEKPLTDS